MGEGTSDQVLICQMRGTDYAFYSLYPLQMQGGCEAIAQSELGRKPPSGLLCFPVAIECYQICYLERRIWRVESD